MGACDSRFAIRDRKLAAAAGHRQSSGRRIDEKASKAPTPCALFSSHDGPQAIARRRAAWRLKKKKDGALLERRNTQFWVFEALLHSIQGELWFSIRTLSSSTAPYARSRAAQMPNTEHWEAHCCDLGLDRLTKDTVVESKREGEQVLEREKESLETEPRAGSGRQCDFDCAT